MIKKLKEFLNYYANEELQKNYELYQKRGWNSILDDDEMMSHEQYEIIKKNEIRKKKLDSL